MCYLFYLLIWQSETLRCWLVSLNNSSLLTNGSACSNQQTFVGEETREETLRTSAWEAMPESAGSEVTFFGLASIEFWGYIISSHYYDMLTLDSCYRKMDHDLRSEDCNLENQYATLCGFFPSRCIISALVWVLSLKQVDRISIEVALSFSLNSETTTSYFGEEKIVTYFFSLYLFCTITGFCLRLIFEVPKILKLNSVPQWLGRLNTCLATRRKKSGSIAWDLHSIS